MITAFWIAAYLLMGVLTVAVMERFFKGPLDWNDEDRILHIGTIAFWPVWALLGALYVLVMIGVRLAGVKR